MVKNTDSRLQNNKEKESENVSETQVTDIDNSELSDAEAVDQTDDTETATPAEEQEHEAPLTAQDEWSDFFKTACIAIVLALIIRTFFYEPFNIPSGSMKPTLEVGDYLFVSKQSYGFSRHSFPFGLAPIEEGRIWTGGKVPQRGDIVVFKLPTNTRIDYIKRIIGMPGDTIQMIDGQLYLNRKIVPRKPLGLKRIEENGQLVTVMEYLETLPGGIEHLIYEESDEMPLDNTEEYVVPEGHYFMMGDNRDNSQDSRVQSHVGYVPLENFIGKADFIFYSTNGTAGLAEFWKWPKTVRYERLFMDIKPRRSLGEEGRVEID